jgi:hypothetical protein
VKLSGDLVDARVSVPASVAGQEQRT